MQTTTVIKRLHRVVAAVLATAALMAGQTAWADCVWTVTNDDNVFTITRSESGTAETVKYHTVSLSALAGKHFTAVSGTLAFAADETSKTVTVTETAKDKVAKEYRFQTVTSRSYRLEVTNTNGYLLAYRDRIIEFGNDYQYKTKYLNNSIENLVIFNQNGEFSTLESNDIARFLMNKDNKFIDVGYDPSTNANHEMVGDYIMIDDGYDYNDKTLCTIPTANVFLNAAANEPLQSYLNDLGVRMYATVCFTMKEEDDGYQYIQILVDKPSAHDGKDPDGKVKKPSESLYKACFELSKSNPKVVTDDHKVFFPHKNSSNQPGDYEWEYADAWLWNQAYKSSSYDAPGNGALNLDPRVRDINVRFDANGKDDDTWYLKNMFVRLALLDKKRPDIIPDEVQISAATYNRGNTVYISVPFTEIVQVTGAPAINTTWGTLRYLAGSGTNVLTFSGVINAPAGTKLQITGLSGGVEDPAGNEFYGYEYRSKVFNECVSTEMSTPVDTPYLTFNGFATTSGYSRGSNGPEDEYPRLVDGTTTSQWFAENGMGDYFPTSYVEFTYGSPIVPKGYILTTGSTVSVHSGRNPTKWALKGKINRGDPWTDLATVENGTLPTTDRTDVRFLIDNAKGYQYFRFEVSAVQGKEGEYHKMELSELQLLGTFETDVNHNMANSTISGLDAYYEYTGSDIPISYTVTALDGTVLEKGTDFTEEFTLVNSTDRVTVSEAGSYTLHINGKAPYSGEQTATFTVSAATAVTSGMTSIGSGVYEVTGNVTTSERIVINGTVTLYLREGCLLTAEKGIQVGVGAKLIINGPGSLTAKADDYDAAIGATHTDGDYCRYGEIVINGGTIKAEGGYYAAAIGGGRDNWNGWNDANSHTPSVTINGGTVNAYGGVYAAGIGGGCNKIGDYDCGAPGNITINGGQVKAWSHGDGGGIGIGKGGNSRTANGSLVLGWTDSDNDFVDASRYNMDYISFASDKEFLIAGSNIMASTSNITYGCKIIPKTAEMDNNLAYTTVSGIAETYQFTNQEITLDYTVTDIYSNTLEKGKDYTEAISPSPVKAAGDYTLTLNGAGSYAGTQQTVCFKVVYPAPTGLHQTAYTKNAATIGWEGNAPQYDVQYGENPSFTTPTEFTVTTNAAQITGLTPLNAYYARVRIASGDLGEWSEPIAIFATEWQWVGAGAPAEDSSDNLPLNSYYAYNLTQQIYTPDEIGRQGTIAGISFCNHSEWDQTREPVNIFMVHTDKTAFDSDNDWINVTTADLVFNGTIQFNHEGWTTIGFSKPFVHDTDQNVALIIQEGDGGWDSQSMNFRTYEGTENNTLYQHQDNEEMDATNSDINTTVTGKRTAKKSQMLLRFNPVISLADKDWNTSVIQQHNFEHVDVTLADRTLLKDGNWNTLCLPFEVTQTQLDDRSHPLHGSTIMELDVDSKEDDGTTPKTRLASDGTLYLYFTTVYDYFYQSDGLKAGTPYIIKWDKADNYVNDDAHNLVSPVFTDVTFDDPHASEVSFTGGSFTGTFDPVVLTANDKTKLFLGEGNMLHYPNADMAIGACRAYFQINGSETVNHIKLFFGDDRPTLVSLPSGKETAGVWYDLQGRKVYTPSLGEGRGGLTPGIYINNGIKVVVK
ncbi:MAG: hypothetical protein J5545_04345 [Bacteroidaceae bacterium]|nr:hypothetical protein [Bacteroidaceae bacterium]